MKKVVLVTGWASPKEIWSPVCSLLSDEYLLQVVTAHEILEQGPDIWKALSKQRPICVGWSMGGMLLLEAISQGLIECKGLVLVASCSRMHSANGLLERTLRSMQKRLEIDSKQVLNEFWQSVGVQGAQFVSYGQAQQTLLEGLKYLSEGNLSSKLALVEIPTTVVHGKSDKVIPLELGQKLAAGIKGAKFVPLAAGHDLPFSQAEAIAEEIRLIDFGAKKLEFSDSASTYDLWAEPQRVIGQTLLDITEKFFSDGQKVLDVGCGTGFLTAAIKKRFPRSRITGLDNAPGMIELCRNRFKDCLDTNFVLSDAVLSLPTGPNDPWNFIVSNSMLQWVSNLQGCLSSWKDELAADGKIIFATLVNGSFSEFEESYLNVLGRKSSSLTWKESADYLAALRRLNLEVHFQEERSYTFSYKSSLEALSVFKKIGAVYKQGEPLTIKQLRELCKYYENNFPAELGGVTVSYKALFVVAEIA